MAHLLVTNDFPPKLGGIQTYLYELWRRLPPGMATIYTTSYDGAPAFDASEGLDVVRSEANFLWPTRSTVEAVRRLARSREVALVVIDPALPLGLIGPELDTTYGVVVHGAEITVPSRLPVARGELRKVLASAAWIVAAGGYPAEVARLSAGRRVPPITEVPPGVDTERFQPLSPDDKRAARERFGLPAEGLLVVSISRLVPRKGMDVLIRAIAQLRRTRPSLELAIGGVGRDERRLRLLAAEYAVPVRFLGRLSAVELPLAYGAADVYAMCCRDRWWGMEQEGFGIVFLEAAACGVPQLAGRSGGSAEAVEHGRTGFVVDRPASDRAVAAALAPLLDDASLREEFGRAARRRVEEHFSYEKLAKRLERALVEAGG